MAGAGSTASGAALCITGETGGADPKEYVGHTPASPAAGTDAAAATAVEADGVDIGGAVNTGGNGEAVAAVSTLTSPVLVAVPATDDGMAAGSIGVGNDGQTEEGHSGKLADPLFSASLLMLLLLLRLSDDFSDDFGLSDDNGLSDDSGLSERLGRD